MLKKNELSEDNSSNKNQPNPKISEENKYKMKADELIERIKTIKEKYLKV